MILNSRFHNIYFPKTASRG